MAGPQPTRKPGRSVFFQEPNGAETSSADGGGDSGPKRPVAVEDETRLRLLLDALKAMRQGNFSVRLPQGGGLLGEIAQAFNEVVGLNECVANEIVRVSKVISEEGKLTERPSLPATSGMWATEIDSIRILIDSLAQPT